MPQPYHINDFSLGWLPSDDPINGRKQGATKFDNLTLDENGAITLAKGTVKAHTTEFTHDVQAIYSRWINGAKHRYAALLNEDIRKDVSDDFGTLVITSASSEAAAFGTAFGQVLISKGGDRVKDDGTTIRNLGVVAPTAQVQIDYPTPPNIDVSGSSGGTFVNWQNVETSAYDESNDWIAFDTDNSTNRGIVQVVHPAPVDTTALSGGSIGTDDDTFLFDTNVSDSSLLIKMRVEFYKDDPGTGAAGDPTSDDYFFFEWLNDDVTPFKQGIWQPTTLNTGRRDFKKVGSAADLNWDSIKAMRLIVLSSGPISVAAGGFRFEGGTGGPLHGSVQYVQVNVNNTGSYFAMSGMGPISKELLNLQGTYLKITPDHPTDPQVNEVWIYRRSGNPSPDVTAIGEQSTLDRFYRIAVIQDPYPQFNDTVSDQDALVLNEVLNESLISVHDIPDAIRGIAGPINGRMLYMTYKEIYISLVGNPDTCDAGSTLLTGGAVSEINLFITKVSNSIILLGTTQDIYEITGSFGDLPDGFIDVTIRALGLGFPPISEAFCHDSAVLFYAAADGWRMLSGNQTYLISQDLDLLWRGQTRYDVPGVDVRPQNDIKFSCCLSKNRLWTTQFLLNGDAICFVYDLSRKYWRKYTLTQCDVVFAEEDGTVLGGFFGAGRRFVKVLDSGTSIDGVAGLSLEYQTFFHDAGTPRNRKDMYTLKFRVDTGGNDVTVTGYTDGGTTPVSLGTINSNGMSEVFLDISGSINLSKAFQIKLTCAATTTFRLEDISVDFDLRPEQLTHLRVAPNNLGTFSRKRFISFPIIIDTLGNNVTVTPVIDGVAQTGKTINESDKTTYVYYFTSDTVGTDIGFILTSPNNYFEFYEVDWKESTSEKLPVPTEFLLIPQDDYGTSARKRFSSYKFVINTRGSNVTFTPRIDGVDYGAATVNTTEKRTFEYYFTSDTIGIDIGGTLSGTNPFEFYGPLRPKVVEELPERLKFFVIPENNFGVAARKRIRTLPLVINTNGSNVTFTPIVDNIALASTVLNTDGRITQFHFFTDDVFGIDFKGTLLGSSPFEFYGMMTPENVETLPVAKKFDQVGPVELKKLGKVIQFRVRIVPTGTSLPYNLFMEDTSILTGTFTTVPNKEDVYETLVPKSMNGTVMRLELGGPGTSYFHRYYVEFKINLSGAGTDSQWVKIK